MDILRLFGPENRKWGIQISKIEQTPLFAIFGAEYRNKPLLQYLIFGFENRRTRSIGRRSDERREEGGDFLEDGGVIRRWGVLRSSGFEERRNARLRSSGPKERKTPHLLSYQKNEEPSHFLLLPTLPSRRLAILRSGSAARSSTLKIGPKIEIGPLLPLVNRWFCSSIDLHRIFFVRAFEESPWRVVPIILRATGTGNSWAPRSVSPVPPRRPACVRPASTRP